MSIKDNRSTLFQESNFDPFRPATFHHALAALYQDDGRSRIDIDRLDDQALLILLLLSQESSTCSMLEDFADAFVCLCRTF
jgi:hypothetical protein